MKYRVEITPSALDDVEAVFNWIAANAPGAANRWKTGILAAIDSLASMPMAHGLAPEATFLRRPLRQTFYGKRGGVYRILYEVIGDTATIIGIRHGARRFLHEED
jgi:toxin ParE1/3/4